MGYRRKHIRIPVSGSAVLSCRQDKRIHTKVVNISEGGLAVACWPPSLDATEYLVKLKTKNGFRIQLTGSVIHSNKHTAGLKTVMIDRKNLDTIHRFIEGFQASEEFIQQIDKKDLITDWFIDENGDELDFSFETPN